MIVRVIRGDSPHTVLAYRCEIELVVQRAVHQSQRHISSKSISRHSMLLNPEITGITAVVFPIIIFVAMTFKPIKQIAYWLRMIDKHCVH